MAEPEMVEIPDEALARARGEQVMPNWADLSGGDKAQVVMFLRTAEDEGLGYAWENYPPSFSDALGEIESGGQVRRMFGADYAALDYGDEFWRLYEAASNV